MSAFVMYISETVIESLPLWRANPAEPRGQGWLELRMMKRKQPCLAASRLG